MREYNVFRSFVDSTWGSGIGYIGDDASKEPFIPTYGGPAVPPVSPTSVTPKMQGAMKGGKRMKKYLPFIIVGGVAAFFLMKKFKK